MPVCAAVPVPDSLALSGCVVVVASELGSTEADGQMLLACSSIWSSSPHTRTRVCASVSITPALAKVQQEERNRASQKGLVKAVLKGPPEGSSYAWKAQPCTHWASQSKAKVHVLVISARRNRVLPQHLVSYLS
jgi:hypothetical protein